MSYVGQDGKLHYPYCNLGGCECSRLDFSFDDYKLWMWANALECKTCEARFVHGGATL
jgi:hypothetical protein